MDDVAAEPVISTVDSGRLQLEASSEENWTTDDEAIDTPGMTHAPNSPAPQRDSQPRSVPSEPARLAAEAVMRTTFPTMLVLLCRYPQQQRIAGSGEDHAV